MGDEHRDLPLAMPDRPCDLDGGEDKPARRMQHEVQRHLGIGERAGPHHVLGIVDVDVPHEREPKQAHRLLPVHEQDHPRAALPLNLGDHLLPRGLQQPLLDDRLERGHHEQEPHQIPDAHEPLLSANPR